MVRTESQKLKVIEEYYIYDGFTGKENYSINKNMIFVKNLGVNMQIKDYESGNFNLVDEQYQPSFGMDESTIDEEFPLISQDILMF